MKKYILILASILTIFSSCTEDENNTSPKSVLTVQFKHFYKNQALQIVNDNLLIYLNAELNQYNVKSLKYYISKIIFEREDGTMYDVNMYKLVNAAESEAFNQYRFTDIPNGQYKKIHFTFGIDSARNVLQGLPNNSETNSMEWPVNLGAGYHFMMLEGVFKKSDNSLSGYAIHLGKTPNQYKAEFNIDLNVQSGSDYKINVQMNVDQWFDGINKVNLNNGYGYIMEDSLKQIQFKQNASSVFSIVQE